VCDIQGGIHSKGVILTDPAIHSKKGEFGVTDHGPHGISTFFSTHRCNMFCCSFWRKPVDCTQYLEPQEGTSMSASGIDTLNPPPPRFVGQAPKLNLFSKSVLASSPHRAPIPPALPPIHERGMMLPPPPPPPFPPPINGHYMMLPPPPFPPPINGHCRMLPPPPPPPIQRNPYSYY
jgi:hypothetical protein